MEYLKLEKGITLIALVITIIVLLILAGVSINLVVGENGVLKKAQKSAIETKRAEEEEQRQLDVDVAIMSEYEGTVPGKKDSSQNRTLSGQTTGFSYKNPIIPKGFIASNDGAGWYYVDDAQTEVKGWNDGLVIEDELGNQFVWVPVDGDKVRYERRIIEDSIQLSDLATDEKAYPDGITTETEEKLLIEKYQGFYVARFEAGLERESNENYPDGDTTPLNIEDTPVSKYGVKVWNSIEYLVARKSAKKMIDTAEVKSAIITGTAYDTIMNWYAISGVDISYPQSWGTYTGLDYSGNGYYYKAVGEEWQNGEFSHIAGDITNRYFHASGLNKNGYKKNIADLGGNFAELTSEYLASQTWSCYYRGWCAYSHTSAATRNKNAPGWGYLGVSFRVMLYIY